AEEAEAEASNAMALMGIPASSRTAAGGARVGWGSGALPPSVIARGGGLVTGASSVLGRGSTGRAVARAGGGGGGGGGGRAGGFTGPLAPIGVRVHQNNHTSWTCAACTVLEEHHPSI